MKAKIKACKQPRVLENETIRVGKVLILDRIGKKTEQIF